MAPAVKSKSVSRRPLEISTQMAADLVGCSHDSILLLLDRGEMKGWRMSDRGWWRIDHASVEAFLKRRKNGARRTKR
jgi:excisionase family DNA binding protein